MKFYKQNGSYMFSIDFYDNEPILEYIEDDIITEFMSSLPGVIYVDGLRDIKDDNGVGFRIDIIFAFDDMQAHVSDVTVAIDTYLVKKGVLKKQDRNSFILKGLGYSENKVEGESVMFGRKSPYDKFIDSLKDVDISGTNKDFMSSFNISMSEDSVNNKELMRNKLKGTTTFLENCVVKGSLDSIIETLAFAKSVSGNSVLSKVNKTYYLTITGKVDFKVCACEVFTSEQSLIFSAPKDAEIVIEQGAIQKLASVSHNSVEELN